MTLQIERLRTIEQLKAFVAGSAPMDCKPLDRESAYDFVRRTLVAFDYHRLGQAAYRGTSDTQTPETAEVVVGYAIWCGSLPRSGGSSRSAVACRLVVTPPR